MTVLVPVAFVAGLITGISPCIVPVLPVIVAAGASSESRWRPVSVVAGLVASFTVATLAGVEVLGALHLPDDVLYYAGIALLAVLGIGLLVPAVGGLLERPFARIGHGAPKVTRSGLALGASCGLVFVPCAGPVLATITTLASAHRVGATLTFMTVAYAIGAGIPLLVIAAASFRLKALGAIRARLPLVRRVAGAVIVLSAVVIWSGWLDGLQRAVPGYTSALQDNVERAGPVTSRLNALEGHEPDRLGTAPATVGADLMDYGVAPDFTGITKWLNTPGDRPLTIGELRGKVVLVDFWTYSCINCQRSLPHVEAWYREYHRYGFDVVGVHTPEFAFEHVVSNVRAEVAKLGVDYPVAIDDDYATWNAYENEYWPAEYLIDQQGVIRHEEFGEGDYAGTETAIRALLEAGGATKLPPVTDVPNLTPTGTLTDETYVGYERLQDEDFYASPALHVGTPTAYSLRPGLPSGVLGFGGTWDVGAEEATAGRGAQLELRFEAADVYLVMGGTGNIEVSVDGRHVRSVHVSGVPSLYTMVGTTRAESADLTLSFSPGLEAYDFTFG